MDRICKPLQMNDTRITLTEEMKARLAGGHNARGEPVGPMDFQTLLGNGALRSSANDMLKLLGANLGLPKSKLTPIMAETHIARAGCGEQALGWVNTGSIAWKNGGTFGCRSFAGIDLKRHRAVVVLANMNLGDEIDGMGYLALQSEWDTQERPTAVKGNPRTFASSVGQYELVPDFAFGVSVARYVLLNAPTWVICIFAGLSLAILFVVVRRVTRVRTKRWIIIGCAIFVSSLLLAFIGVVVPRGICARIHSRMGIRFEGGRLFAQYSDRIGFQLTVELLPESETRFFERMSGIPITFSRDSRGKMSRLTAQYLGVGFPFAKISDQPPKVPPPPKPRVAVKLDAKLYDAYVGDYEFSSNAAAKMEWKVPTLRVRREDNILLGQVIGIGAFELCPESETTFFVKLVDAQVTFVKNESGKVTSVIVRDARHDKYQGQRVPLPPRYMDGHK